MQLLETSIIDLYNNTVKAFPLTTKRQYSTDTIKIEKLDWIPFLGMKTLFIKGLAKNESKKYECIMLFKNVIYKESIGKKIIKIKTTMGSEHFVEQIDSSKNGVLVSCQCKDFQWRFRHFNKSDKSLYGRDRAKYEALINPGISNPMELSGLCKHLIKMAKIIKESNLLV